MNGRGQRQWGKVHWLVPAAILGALLTVVFAFLKPSSPQTGAQAFMIALAKADVDGLMRYGYLEGRNPADVRKQWEYATQVAAPYYRFEWVIQSSESRGDEGTVRMQIVRNADSSGAYQEAYEMKMVRVNGEWKVDLNRSNRMLFPMMPR